MGVLFTGTPLAVMALASCVASTPRYPPFQGTETESWLAHEVTVPERAPDDLLASFEASAQSYGCRTQRLGRMTHAVPNATYQLVGRATAYWTGIDASCDDGHIALVTLAGARVRIGCARPTTRERCDLLLQSISLAR